MFEDVQKNQVTAPPAPAPGLTDADQSVAADHRQSGQSSSPVSPPPELSRVSQPVEVEDVLAGTDRLPPPVVNTSSFQQGKAESPPAVEKFTLAREPTEPGQPAVPPLPPEPQFTDEDVEGKKKILLAGIGVAVLLLLGIGGYIAYQRFFAGAEIFNPTTRSQRTDSDEQTPVAAENDLVEPEQVLVEVVFPLDSDGDGLTDEEEAFYGTDPFLADTDGDGLFDREEIFTWQTDPLNPDTDGDGYLDGEEVRQGYNPLGPGKLDFYDYLR